MGNTIPLVVLGLIEATIAFVMFTNVSSPIIGNNRLTLIAFIVIGFAMCSMGMGISQYEWTNPFNLAGILTGLFALIIGLAALFGARLLWIADERAAILTMALLMAVKILVAGARGLVS